MCLVHESTRVSVPNVLIKFVRGVQNFRLLSVELTESVGLILFGFVLSPILFRVTKKKLNFVVVYSGCQCNIYGRINKPAIAPWQRYNSKRIFEFDWPSLKHFLLISCRSYK